MRKTQIAITLRDDNLEWIENGVDEGRFRNRSEAIDDVILDARQRESPEAVAEARRLQDADNRARKAEEAIIAIGWEFGIRSTDDVDMIVSELIRLQRDSVLEAMKKERADIVAHLEAKRAQAQARADEILEDIEARIAALEAKQEESK